MFLDEVKWGLAILCFFGFIGIIITLIAMSGMGLDILHYIGVGITYFFDFLLGFITDVISGIGEAILGGLIP